MFISFPGAAKQNDQSLTNGTSSKMLVKSQMSNNNKSSEPRQV